VRSEKTYEMCVTTTYPYIKPLLTCIRVGLIADVLCEGLIPYGRT
jgi:hypothetical protein